MRTNDTTPVEAPAGAHEDMPDETFGQLVGIGFLLGIPATFIVLFTGLVITTGITEAAPAIFWSAVVGGGYFGGFAVLSAHFARLEREERAARVPVRAEPESRRLAA